MIEGIEIRWAKAEERNSILSFIERMGFNPRDAVTWDGLEMVAMTAWQEEQLIGAIPLEPRPLRICIGQTVWTMHETVVAIAPEFRSRGIGSAMQRQIAEGVSGEPALLSVFREEPQSKAYRWYLKNGFEPAIHIDSWFHEKPTQARTAGIDLLVPHDTRVPWDLLDEIWRAARQQGGGFVDQSQRTLRDWLNVHPYRKRYTFALAIERGRRGQAPGYAILGVGEMHSQARRCDILDIVSKGGTEEVQRLLDEILPLAGKLGCESTRWPLAEHDPNVAVASAIGFEKRWGFDMLVRQIDQSIQVDPQHWRYAAIDYI